MARRDGFIVAILVVVLAVLGGATLAPAFAPPPAASPSPTPALSSAIREGIVSRPVSVTPVSARSQADRDLVALLFRGLVKFGADGTPVPDLATSWKSESKGSRWTFALRQDAHWGDGIAVTADDVVFTIHVLQDPSYDGPLAGGWEGVTVTALDPYRVRFDLQVPLAGFLAAAAQPLLPEHILRGVAASDIGGSDFAGSPVGDGAFAIDQLDVDHAVLVPVVEVAAQAPLATGQPVAAEPGRPYIDELDLEFYDTPEALATAYKNGEVDLASGLSPAAAAGLAATAGNRLVRYPATTLTGVVLNLRPGEFAFADKRARLGLLEAIDRGGLVSDLLAGAGTRADSLVPPTSWAFNGATTTPVAFDPLAAAKDLAAGGWKVTGGTWIAPHAKAAADIELLAPTAEVNPVANAAAHRVAVAWQGLGLGVKVTELSAADFVDRLRGGDFSAAVVDQNVGLDPDLYPLLASSQAAAGGSNVSGIQSTALDAALAKARQPGTTAARRQAFADLQKLLSDLQPILPLFFRDVTVVASDRVSGTASRIVADASQRFGDVVTWRLVGR
jgi:peptide/nickel transport system substrate-binding protein